MAPRPRVTAQHWQMVAWLVAFVCIGILVAFSCTHSDEPPLHIATPVPIITATPAPTAPPMVLVDDPTPTIGQSTPTPHLPHTGVSGCLAMPTCR